MLRLLLPQNPPEAALPPAGTPTVSLRGETMGTYWAVSLIDPQRRDPLVLRRGLTACLGDVIAAMSHWDRASDLSRFNDAAAGTWVPVPADLLTVTDCALAVASASGGAYDPTLGPLVDLWGFGPTGPAPLPTAAAIAAAQARCGWERLRIDPAQGRLWQPGGLRLDLSAIAKGFAVDKLASFLRDQGIPSYLVDIGGELRGWGIKPDANPWWVELEPAHTLAGEEGGRRTRVALHGLSIATSGDSRRFIQQEGRRLSHTIDPRTGAPIPDRLASVTVLHRDCMRADVWATALSVLGPDAGMDLAVQEGLAALFLLRGDSGIEERMSPAFAALEDAP